MQCRSKFSQKIFVQKLIQLNAALINRPISLSPINTRIQAFPCVFNFLNQYFFFVCHTCLFSFLLMLPCLILRRAIPPPVRPAFIHPPIPFRLSWHGIYHERRMSGNICAARMHTIILIPDSSKIKQIRPILFDKKRRQSPSKICLIPCKSLFFPCILWYPCIRRPRAAAPLFSQAALLPAVHLAV